MQRIHHHRLRGFTLTELMIASAIGTGVAIGLMSLTITTSRMNKSTFYQQVSLKQAQKATEGINREIRLATTPLRVLNDAGVDAVQGNVVLFSRLGEPADQRSIWLESVDDDLSTPWDNTLVFDPDTAVDGDEQVLARWVIPIEEAGAFRYGGATTPLTVWMRTGDPVGGDPQVDNAHSGPGLQGVEINITVAPRN